MIDNFILFLKKIKISLIFFFKHQLIHQKKKKKFKKDIKIFIDKLNRNENFAFVRFSDGELFILENKKLIISKNYWSLNNKKIFNSFDKNDQKEFIPSKHQFYRNQLIESIIFKKKNYFKGISCSCCNGKKNVNFMKNFCNNDKNLTFSNLLQNNNYPEFVETIVKIFKKKNIILVANKNHDQLKLPFRVKKKFNIGKNCLINDFNIIEKIKNFIKNNKIEDHLFLISASSLSNILIMKLFKNFDKNTYLDVGSTLNAYYSKNILSKSRSYLSEYWLNDQSTKHLKKICYW